MLHLQTFLTGFNYNMMDVFIPEEYVLRRRMERKAADARERLSMEAEKGMKAAAAGRLTTASGLGQISRVPTETCIVFSCCFSSA